MDKSTISILKAWIKKNPALNNSALAKLIKEESTLDFTEGSLRNYIAQVRKLDNKVVDTSVGHIHKDLEKAKEASLITTDFIPEGKGIMAMIEEAKPTEEHKTIHDHIKGYLVAYSGTSFSEIARIMHQNRVGLDFSEGTLRNYISKNAKEIGAAVPDAKSKSTSEIYATVKNIKEDSPIGFDTLHIVTVIDEALRDSHYLENYIDHSQSISSQTRHSLFTFSESINCLVQKSIVDFVPEINHQASLRINLYNAIMNATMSLFKNTDKVKEYGVLNIITSGFDNASSMVSSRDIQEVLTRIQQDFKWTVNLIYLQPEELDAYELSNKLGIDTSNTLFCANDGYIVKEALIKSFNKQLNHLRNKEIRNTRTFA